MSKGIGSVKKEKSLFFVEMNGEKYYCENTSGLDADGLIEAYAACEKPFAEMYKYGSQISEADYAYIAQGDNLTFSIHFDSDRDEITISDGERGKLYETRGLQETIAEKKAEMGKNKLGTRSSILKNLHSKQSEINRNQKNAEQRAIEKSDRGMER